MIPIGVRCLYEYMTLWDTTVLLPYVFIDRVAYVLSNEKICSTVPVCCQFDALSEL